MTMTLYPGFGILIVDDEPAWLRALGLALERAGITNLTTCQDSRDVLQILSRGTTGLVLLDLTMPHLSGTELLEQIRSDHPDVSVIIVSGLNQVETAVRCVKDGAFDYFVKTSEAERLVAGVVRAIRVRELELENRQIASRMLSGTLVHPEVFTDIVTRDRTMLSIFAYLEAVAPSPEPLLITGESGVGKEPVARAAHTLSGCGGPFVAVNVAGLDDTVFADTLFGHTRGAFTGAEQPRRGMVEEASGGTLFLDEVGDLSSPSQVKLLRFLQEGEYFQLGSDRAKRLRARVIVATNQDLAKLQEAGTFRRDLYYRLRTHHVHIPPLRERTGDIPLLLDHFLEGAARSLGKKKPTAPRELAQLLGTYGFPGNVRELKAMVYDAVSVHRERVLSMDSFLRTIGHSGDGQSRSGGLRGPDRNPFTGVDPLPSIREAVEFLVDQAMERSGGNQTIAARLVGITQSALSKRLKARRR